MSRNLKVIVLCMLPIIVIAGMFFAAKFWLHLPISFSFEDIAIAAILALVMVLVLWNLFRLKGRRRRND